MTHWMRPPELARALDLDQFDPVIEGARYGLSREWSLATWERVCADATDSTGRIDADQTQRRFHDIAVRIQSRGGRLRPDVGRLTRVQTEILGVPRGTWPIDELDPRTPGRTTLVIAEMQRLPAYNNSLSTLEIASGEMARPELPGASEVKQAIAALQASLPDRVSERRSMDVHTWGTPGHLPAPLDVRRPPTTAQPRALQSPADAESAHGSERDNGAIARHELRHASEVAQATVSHQQGEAGMGLEDHFDPVIDGARHRLSRELLLAIWETVCRDASDSAGRLGADHIQRRFHELAAQIAARGGRLHPDVGRLTRVPTETADVPRGASTVDDLARRTPGQTTLVAADTRPSTASGWLLSHPLLVGDVATPAPGRHTVVGHAPDPRPGFEDYRVLGLKGVLRQLGPTHPRRAELVAAAASTDRSIAGRATLWREPLPITATPDGHALWHAAERHAAMLYRRAMHDGVVEDHDPAIESALQRRGTGQSLSVEVRRDLERALGVSLARVCVHTDAVAVQAARVLDAEAFTVGEDIFFAEGAFAPETDRGIKLLAHELAHVIQGWQGRTATGRDGIQVSEPSDPLEREADAVAERLDHAGTLRPETHLDRTVGGRLNDATPQQDRPGSSRPGNVLIDMAPSLAHHSRGHTTPRTSAPVRAAVIQRQHVRLASGRYVGDLPGSTSNVREDVLRVMDKLHELWSLGDPDYSAEYPVVSGAAARSNIPVGRIPRTIAALRANEQPTLAAQPAQPILGITLSMPVGRGQPNHKVDIYALQDALHSLWHLSNTDYSAERAAVNGGPDPVPEGIIPRTIAGIAQMKTAYVSGQWRGTGGVMQGTSPITAGQQTAIQPQLTPGVPPGTAFQDVVGGRSYRDRLWEMLERLRAQWYQESHDLLAAPTAPMSRFEEIAAEAKQQVDADFGQYVTGPALTAAAGNLVDMSTFPPNASNLIDYLINEDDHSEPIRTRHGADNGRSTQPTYTVPGAGVTNVAQVAAANHTTAQAIASANGLAANAAVSPGQVLLLPFEPDIVSQLITDYISDPTRVSQYEVIDRAWPGGELQGRVGIQRAVPTEENARRRAFWDNFQTVIHEHLHSITHPNYTRVAEDLGGAQKGVLVEGGTSLFTDHVWQRLSPAEIRANAMLRRHVEGRAHPYTAGVIPPISHYHTIAQARNIEGTVGPENMRAAYFLGRTELLGLTTPGTYVVPPSGVTTVADVAFMTGMTAEAIAALNSPLTPSSSVTAGQSLRLR